MKISFDFRDFERAAKRMDALATQVPFALARSLNDAAEAARRELVEETWPRHVTVRNRGFIRSALTTKGTRATKRNLSVTIYDRLRRAGLELHAEGGTKRARGSNLAIPDRKVAARRTGKGVPKNLRPRALPASFKRGDALFQRTGRYQKGAGRKGQDGRGLKLMYVLKPSVQIPAAVPFHQDFARAMRREMPRAFRRNLEIAMKTSL